MEYDSTKFCIHKSYERKILDKTSVMYKIWITAGNQLNIPLHYTKLTYQLSVKTINLKVDHHTGDKCLQNTKQCLEYQFRSLEHSILIMLCQICESDIREVCGNMSSERIILGRQCRKSNPYISCIHNKWTCYHPVCLLCFTSCEHDPS